MRDRSVVALSGGRSGARRRYRGPGSGEIRRAVECTAEKLEKRALLSTYAWNPTAGTLLIDLGTDEQMTINEAAGTRTFHLTSGAFSAGGTAATGDGTGTITFAAADNIGTSIAVNNAGDAAPGDESTTFLGGNLTSGRISVDLTQTAGTTSAISFTTAGTNFSTSAVSLTSPTTISEGVGGSISATTGRLTSNSVTGTTLGNANAITTFNATNTSSGNISLTNTATTLRVSGISQDGTGSVSVANSGALNVTGAVSTGGGGDITLAADNMAIDAAVNAGTGIVTLEQAGTAARDIDLGAGNIPNDLQLSDGELSAVTASVLRIGRLDNTGTVNISGPVTQQGFGILHLITGGAVAQSNDGALDVVNVAISATTVVKLVNNVNDVTNLAADSTTAGYFLELRNGTNALTVPGGGLDGVVGVTTNNSAILFQADSINIGAAINAGTGSVTFNPVSFHRPVVLGSKPAGSLGLTNAELDHITAGRLLIGDFDTPSELDAPITITSPVTAPSTWSTLELFSEAGTIRQDSGASITVKNLAATGGAGVYLSDPGNTVTNLGGGIGGGSGLTFNFVNSTSLNIVKPNGGTANGIESGGSAINITALGSGSVLTVNARISSPQGFGSYIPTVTLTADEIALNALVSAGDSGTLTLEQGSTTTRGIDLGGGNTPGELDLSDTELGEVNAAVLRIGRADNAGNITVTAPVTQHAGFKTLSLISGGAVDNTNGAGPDVTATNLAATAAGGINLDTAVSDLAFKNAAGAVSIRNSAGLAVDEVDRMFSSSNAGGDTTLSANGEIIFAVNTTSAGTLGATATDAEARTPVPPPEDNITINGGVTVESTGGDVNLTSGDGILIGLSGRVLAPAGNIGLSCGVGDTDSDGLMNISGTLSALGSVTFNLAAADTATLTGTATASRTIEIGGGSLFVNAPGSIDSAVAVDAGALGGTGRISGAVNVQPGATLATGVHAPGILTTGTATLSSTSTFSLQLSGPAPGNTAASYGQLDVNGDVNLNNATLAAALTFSPSPTQTFTLIQATGGINGQFAQGSFMVLNGITYSITYLAHSVVLEKPSDLSVSVSGPGSVIEDSAATYTYSVSNGGPGAARNVVLSAPIPAGAVFVSASFGGGLTLPASAYDPATGTVNLGTLAVGAGGTLTLKVDLPEENTGVSFGATIASATADTDTANNSDSVTTVVNDAPLTAQGRAVSATHGAKTFTDVTVATFTDANLAAMASDFTATVNWGDGTVSRAQIVANSDGTFSVVASHTYQRAKLKSYSLAIRIVDVGGSNAEITGTANL